MAAGSITVVYISGSSAFRDEMVNTLSSICATGSFDSYGADASGDATNDPGTVRNSWDGYATSTAGPFYSYNGPDFRGYACTLSSTAASSAPALTTLEGTDILVYYRAEGGSVWGVVPVATGAKIQHLVIPNPASVPAGEEACKLYATGVVQDNGVTSPIHSGSSADGHHYICSVPMPLYNTNGATTAPSGSKPGWWLPYDNYVGTNLPTYPDAVDLACDVPMTFGMSDVEPAALSGTNYPKNYKECGGGSYGLSPPSAVSTVTTTPLLQQMFAILTDTSGSATSAITTLSRQSINGIFSGQYTNWSQVPESGVSAPITVCRRDPGSGTETMSSIYFGNVYCGSASTLEAQTPFAAGNVINGTILGPGILQFATTGDVQACVGANANSIGISSWSSSAPSGAKFIAVDGETPSQTALLTGAWHDWTEVVAVQPPGFDGTTNPGLLVTGLIQVTADANGGAVKSNTAYAYIPNQPDAQSGDNTPSVANLSKFIAVATKGGDTCKEIVQPSNTD